MKKQLENLILKMNCCYGRELLKKKYFVVAKTPMAKEITIRTLIGYHSEWKNVVNAVYVENIVEDSKRVSAKKPIKLKGCLQI